MRYILHSHFFLLIPTLYDRDKFFTEKGSNFSKMALKRY